MLDYKNINYFNLNITEIEKWQKVCVLFINSIDDNQNQLSCIYILLFIMLNQLYHVFFFF